jgi:hypothetical protein
MYWGIYGTTKVVPFPSLSLLEPSAEHKKAPLKRAGLLILLKADS